MENKVKNRVDEQTVKKAFNFLNICKNLGFSDSNIKIVIKFLEKSYNLLLEKQEFTYPALGKVFIFYKEKYDFYNLSITIDVISVCRPEILFLERYKNLNLIFTKDEAVIINQAFRIAAMVLHYQGLVEIPGLGILYSKSALKIKTRRGIYPMVKAHDTLLFINRNWGDQLNVIMKNNMSLNDFRNKEEKSKKLSSKRKITSFLTSELSSTKRIASNRFLIDSTYNKATKMIYSIKSDGSIIKPLENKVYYFGTNTKDVIIKLLPLFANDPEQYKTALYTHKLEIISNTEKIKVKKVNMKENIHIKSMQSLTNICTRLGLKIINEIKDETSLAI